MKDTPEKPPAVKSRVEPLAGGRSGANAEAEEGEDIQLGGPEERLRRIATQMQVVRRKLDARDTSAATIEVQDAVVRELDELLADLQRGGPAAGAKPSDKPASAGSGDAAGAATGGQERRPDSKPGDAKDSGKPGGEGPATVVGAGARQQLFKQVWGQLPPKMREQMQSALPEKFLPEYEKQIEEYYRRLAEPKSR